MQIIGLKEVYAFVAGRTFFNSEIVILHMHFWYNVSALFYVDLINPKDTQKMGLNHSWYLWMKGLKCFGADDHKYCLDDISVIMLLELGTFIDQVLISY